MDASAQLTFFLTGGLRVARASLTTVGPVLAARGAVIASVAASFHRNSMGRTRQKHACRPFRARRGNREQRARKGERTRRNEDADQILIPARKGCGRETGNAGVDGPPCIALASRRLGTSRYMGTRPVASVVI